MQYNITYRKKDKGIQYIISYKDSDGKWKQKSKQGFPGKKEAKAAADKALEILKESMARLETIEPEYDGISFEKFSKIHLSHERLYREENTIEVKQYALKKFQSINNLELCKVTSLDIQKCVDLMVEEGLSRVSIQHYLSMIKAMFNNAIDQYNLITVNPVKKIKLPEPKRKAEKKALTESEFKDLLSKIDDYKLYLITLIAGGCGLRIGEILGLSWNDIDELNLLINIRKQLKRIGENSKHGIRTLKSENSYRSVPLSPNILSALKTYDNKYPRNIDGRIFNLTNTTSVATRLAYLYKSLGYKISVHELRHTYATILISKGIDFKTVAKLMGHSVEQTLKTYSHVTDEMMSRATMTIRSIF